MAQVKRPALWAWLWFGLGVLFFLLPLVGTLDFSLRAKKGELGFSAYERVLSDPQFLQAFLFSARMAIFTILTSILLLVPTAYWVHLKLPRLRPVIELITLLPFVIPAIVLVFGLIRVYSRPPLLMTDSIFKTDILLVGAYVILTFPYMYRAIDIGLRSIDILTLTEAAQSLGANWYTILFRVIFPNLRVAIISGALITFATVMGEFILAAFLARPALGPYMAELGRTRAFEPAALAMISYALTLVALGLISLISRGSANQQQISGAH
jgi:putative spermidine/putrescine transport system permease protein